MRMSMYEPYVGLINQYVEDGYNLKEINKKLEEQGVYGSYGTFFGFCQKHGISAQKQKCGDCVNCAEYDYKETGGNIRVCLAENRVVKAKVLPKFCNGRFQARTEGRPAE